MDFEDIFRHGNSKYHNDRGFYGGQHDVHHDHHGAIEKHLYFFEKLKSNKKLLLAFSVTAIVIVIFVIAMIFILIPLIIKWLETIQTAWISGLDGLIKAARPLLELLLGGGK